MPPSRIAFAIGDMLNEVRRLLPPDTPGTALLVLDGETFNRVERELRQYGNMSQRTTMDAAYGIALVGLETIKFGGLMIVGLPPGGKIE